MRKLDSMIPQAAEGDEFGQYAVVLMKRAAEIGYDKAIAEELEKPTWDDRDWCRMVVARSQDQVPKFIEDESVTFRCPRCRDTGLIHKATVEKHSTTYQVSAMCDPCQWRMWAKAQWQRREAQEGRGGSRRTRAVFDEG